MKTSAYLEELKSLSVPSTTLHRSEKGQIEANIRYYYSNTVENNYWNGYALYRNSSQNTEQI